MELSGSVEDILDGDTRDQGQLQISLELVSFVFDGTGSYTKLCKAFIATNKHMSLKF